MASSPVPTREMSLQRSMELISSALTGWMVTISASAWRMAARASGVSVAPTWMTVASNLAQHFFFHVDIAKTRVADDDSRFRNVHPSGWLRVLRIWGHAHHGALF